MYNIDEDFDPNQAYGYGDFVILPDGRHGMVINYFEDDETYNVQLWGTFRVVYHIPQDDLTLDEDEFVEERSDNGTD